MENKNLPVLADLYSDTELKIAQNELNVLLNAPPALGWLKDHPFAKIVKVIEGKKVTVPAKYIPIERIEWLLTRIFIRWHSEIKSVQLIANSVVVTVRLYYQDVVTKEMLWQDGVGAVALQTDQGAGAIEFDKIKSSAVQMAAPSAVTYAIKDAAEKIGNLFGKDINRSTQIDYTNLLNSIPKQDKEEKLNEMFENETNNETK
jgi:recombination DNA repair RAD52 pathway protein